MPRIFRIIEFKSWSYQNRVIQLVTKFNINVFNIYENINWYSIIKKTTIQSEKLATVALHSTFFLIFYSRSFTNILLLFFPTIATKKLTNKYKKKTHFFMHSLLRYIYKYININLYLYINNILFLYVVHFFLFRPAYTTGRTDIEKPFCVCVKVEIENSLLKIFF